MKHLSINVLAEDIRRGCPGDAGRCAVALAIKRKIKTGFICVGRSNLILRSEIVQLPAEATAFIDALDNNKPVKPISFKLWIKDEK